MLIQLVEPGTKLTPKEVAIGIDLGTTHSVMAYARGQIAKVLPFEKGQRFLLSTVSYGQETVVGKTQQEGQCVYSIKRLMGQQKVPDGLKIYYPEVLPSDQLIKLKINHQELTPTEISAEILKVIKANAERTLGESICKAVITVPAYFNEPARQETKKAAKLAGLEVLRLINEPTAAALAYGLDKQVEGVYLVYDWGGGTFDVSLLRFTRGVFQVLATNGDPLLGGDDIDYLVFHYLRETYPQCADILTRETAQKMKEALAQQSQVIFQIGGEEISLTLDKLNELFQPLLAKTLKICTQVLQDANLSGEDIQGIILVGGSTRLQAVKQELEEFFPGPLLADMNPDEVVALGAALQADALTYGSGTLLLDMTPLSLGIETMGGVVEKIIQRNTPLPVAIAQEFTTYQDGQTAMKIHVLQGERELVKDCRSLGEFILKGIPPMAAGAAKIQITFQLDADGLMNVTAKEVTSGSSHQIEINPAYGLSDADMIQHLQDNFENGLQDMEQRLLIESRVEANQLLIQLKTALKEDKDLLEGSEMNKLQKAIESLEETMVVDDRNAIKESMNQVEKLSFSFVERRINRSIQRALAGHHIKDII